MSTLTITPTGQITLNRELRRHLGFTTLKQEEKIEFEKLPDGNLILKAARHTGSINDFIGLLARNTTKVATIEEMNEVIAEGWAGKNESNQDYR